MKKAKTGVSHQPSTSTTSDDNGNLTRFQKKLPPSAAKPSLVTSLAVTKYETKKRQERMERFGTSTTGSANHHSQTQSILGSPAAEDYEDMVGPYYDIIGRNMEIEKSYLRLTTYPKCDDVRPLPVLIKALDHVKRKYQQNDDFDWCHDQLKSIRQDITVQTSHIPAHHTLLFDVYQTHARILLEHGHLPEFNQCLSNVLQIYDAWHAQNDSSNSNSNNNNNDNNRNNRNSSIPNPANHGMRSMSTTTCSVKKAEGEFRAYSVLYSLVQSKTTFLDLNMALRRRLQQSPSLIQPERRQSKSNTKKSKKRRRSSTATDDRLNDIRRTNECQSNGLLGMMNHMISVEEQHAWDVVHSIYNGHYTKFFTLYDTASHMSPYILDFLLHRVRMQAYHTIMASYRPSISMPYLQTALHFDTMDELFHFLQQRGTVFVDTSTTSGTSPEHEGDIHKSEREHLMIDCRQSQQILQSPDT